MSKTIPFEIPIPTGFQVESFDTETGKGKLKPIPVDIISQIKSFDDVLKILGKPKSEFEKEFKGLADDTIAYEKAKLVCVAYNEGWKPNWDNSSEYKYYPWFDMRSSASGGFAYDDYGCRVTDSGVGSRLCFKSKEAAISAGKLFEQEIYKPLFILN